jgi:hypothetical protein
MATLPYPKNVEKRRKFTAIDGKPLYVIIEDEIVRPQSDAPDTKLIYLQKLRHEKDNHIEYRFTYYMKGFKGRTRGRWVFGQYSLAVPAKDLKWLLKEARSKNWTGF